MRVAVVTSEHLTWAKYAIIDGLAGSLVGIASVPTLPEQVGKWRHIRGLIIYAGPRRLPALFFRTLADRIRRRPALPSASPRSPRELAESKGAPFLAVHTLADERLGQWLRELRCDLVVSLQSHRVGRALLEAPRLGWLNLHHGRLPDYRGVFSVFWAMMNREPVLYITAHLMGSELDCGPVVIEEPVPVPVGASVDSLEASMWKRSPEAMLRAIARLAEGWLPDARPPGRGRYYSYPAWSDLRRASSQGLKVH